VIVADASVLGPLVEDDDAPGELARARLVGEEITAPALVDLEVLSMVRRLVLADLHPLHRGRQAVRDLRQLPVERVPHGELIERSWELRHTVTTYDASFVALAQALDVTLVTSDARLAGAPGVRCEVEVLASI
jgi:predicted nucleic acid-binding protein